MKTDHQPIWDAVCEAGKTGGVNAAIATVTTKLQARGSESSLSQPKLFQARKRAKKKTGLFRKEAALVMWSVDKTVPLNAFQGKSWERVEVELKVSFGERHTLRALLDPMYAYVTDVAMKSLNSASAVSVSFDLWTAIEKSHYLGISYHWIDKDWSSQSHLLDLLYFPAAATGLLIASVIEDRFDSRVPESSGVILAATVSDRGSNAALAREILAKGDSEHCIPHLVKSTLDDLTERKPKFAGSYYEQMAKDLSSLTQLLMLFNNKPGNMVLLKEKLPGDLKHLGLVFPNDTRWEGRLRMLQRALRLKVGINACFEGINAKAEVRTTCGGDTDFLERSYWVRLGAYTKCYQRFNVFSQLMQSDTITKSAVLAQFKVLENALKQDTDSVILKNAQQKFSAALKTRFGDIVSTVNNTTKAALLDPRNYPQITEWLQNEVIDGCWKSLKEEVDAYLTDKSARKFGKLALDTVRELLSSNTIVLVAELEEGTDPLLAFWKKTMEEQPHLSACTGVIKGILAIPASAAKCERTFSFTTRLVNRLTSSLGRDTVELKTVLKDAMNTGLFDFELFMSWLSNDQTFEDHLANIRAAYNELLAE